MGMLVATKVETVEYKRILLWVSYTHGIIGEKPCRWQKERQV
jgi:hypothetical protein